MKLAAILFLLFLIGCKSGSKETEVIKSDTIKPDVNTAPKDILTGPGPLAIEFTSRLKQDPRNKWIIVDDRSANRAKDQFDYFIAPKRKDQPDYPYVTQGDYDGDGKKDLAALVTDSTKTRFAVLVLTGSGKTINWDEDIAADAAISSVPPSEIIGMDGDNTKTVKIKNDAINVEFFETAAFILYWDGKKFMRLQTGD